MAVPEATDGRSEIKVYESGQAVLAAQRARQPSRGRRRLTIRADGLPWARARSCCARPSRPPALATAQVAQRQRPTAASCSSAMQQRHAAAPSGSVMQQRPAAHSVADGAIPAIAGQARRAEDDAGHHGAPRTSVPI
eukprot:CAMPEP_0202083556 /NCGR_PEP_ID=MMETSP0964-20121228/24377_1 /ASSEMBLY_ACC=CAM_ASM_000500 /TAXON_ID=4773 /ORGANISM="Schizochytrium aggregatum, Strain ATCC28209" /LENGTH=136 /DNA_ID=CAMNT_0048651275 /DNA_START=1050 /DNA_END=1459 /DNA_ORIENTATION=+